MGLDQYLTRKFYVGGRYEHRNVTGEINIKIGDEQYSFDVKNVDYIVEVAGYWREASSIHQWFVDNCQDGEDDCKEYSVSQEQLQELLDIVNKILKCCTFAGKQYISANKEVCEELLPTRAGVVFGGTEYDEAYYEDLLETKRILEENLNEKYTNWYFEYLASW